MFHPKVAMDRCLMQKCQMYRNCTHVKCWSLFLKFSCNWILRELHLIQKWGWGMSLHWYKWGSLIGKAIKTFFICEMWSMHCGGEGSSSWFIGLTISIILALAKCCLHIHQTFSIKGGGGGCLWGSHSCSHSEQLTRFSEQQFRTQHENFLDFRFIYPPAFCRYAFGDHASRIATPTFPSFSQAWVERVAQARFSILRPLLNIT